MTVISLREKYQELSQLHESLELSQLNESFDDQENEDENEDQDPYQEQDQDQSNQPYSSSSSDIPTERKMIESAKAPLRQDWMLYRDVVRSMAHDEEFEEEEEEEEEQEETTSAVSLQYSCTSRDPSTTYSNTYGYNMLDDFSEGERQQPQPQHDDVTLVVGSSSKFKRTSRLNSQEKDRVGQGFVEESSRTTDGARQRSAPLLRPNKDEPNVNQPSWGRHDQNNSSSMRHGGGGDDEEEDVYAGLDDDEEQENNTDAPRGVSKDNTNQVRGTLSEVEEDNMTAETDTSSLGLNALGVQGSHLTVCSEETKTSEGKNTQFMNSVYNKYLTSQDESYDTDEPELREKQPRIPDVRISIVTSPTRNADTDAGPAVVSPGSAKRTNHERAAQTTSAASYLTQMALHLSPSRDSRTDPAVVSPVSDTRGAKEEKLGESTSPTSYFTQMALHMIQMDRYEKHQQKEELALEESKDQEEILQEPEDQGSQEQEKQEQKAEDKTELETEDSEQEESADLPLLAHLTPATSRALGIIQRKRGKRHKTSSKKSSSAKSDRARFEEERKRDEYADNDAEWDEFSFSNSGFDGLYEDQPGIRAHEKTDLDSMSYASLSDEEIDELGSLQTKPPESPAEDDELGSIQTTPPQSYVEIDELGSIQTRPLHSNVEKDEPKDFGTFPIQSKEGIDEHEETGENYRPSNVKNAGPLEQVLGKMCSKPVGGAVNDDDGSIPFDENSMLMDSMSQPPASKQDEEATKNIYAESKVDTHYVPEAKEFVGNLPSLHLDTPDDERDELSKQSEWGMRDPEGSDGDSETSETTALLFTPDEEKIAMKIYKKAAKKSDGGAERTRKLAEKARALKSIMASRKKSENSANSLGSSSPLQNEARAKSRSRMNETYSRIVRFQGLPEERAIQEEEKENLPPPPKRKTEIKSSIKIPLQEKVLNKVDEKESPSPFSPRKPKIKPHSKPPLYGKKLTNNADNDFTLAEGTRDMVTLEEDEPKVNEKNRVVVSVHEAWGNLSDSTDDHQGIEHSFSTVETSMESMSEEEDMLLYIRSEFVAENAKSKVPERKLKKVPQTNYWMQKAKRSLAKSRSLLAKIPGADRRSGKKGVDVEEVEENTYQPPSLEGSGQDLYKSASLECEALANEAAVEVVDSSPSFECDGDVDDPSIDMGDLSVSSESDMSDDDESVESKDGSSIFDDLDKAPEVAVGTRSKHDSEDRPQATIARNPDMEKDQIDKIVIGGDELMLGPHPTLLRSRPFAGVEMAMI